MDVNHLIGIPYVEHGREEDGCDCWGLVRLFYRDCLGIDLPRYDNEYADSEDVREVAALMSRVPPEWNVVPKGEERPGDGVKIRLKGYECHVGVYLGGDKILHIHFGTHAAVINRTWPEWKHRIIGYFRHDLAGPAE